MRGENTWSWVSIGIIVVVLMLGSACSVSCPNDGDRWPSSAILITGGPNDGDRLPSKVTTLKS